jgi:hypothetical protein
LIFGIEFDGEAFLSSFPVARQSAVREAIRFRRAVLVEGGSPGLRKKGPKASVDQEISRPQELSRSMTIWQCSGHNSIWQTCQVVISETTLFPV